MYNIYTLSASIAARDCSWLTNDHYSWTIGTHLPSMDTIRTQKSIADCG